MSSVLPQASVRMPLTGLRQEAADRSLREATLERRDLDFDEGGQLKLTDRDTDGNVTGFPGTEA